MYFDEHNWQDCNKYFQDTYVQFAEAGMDKLFLLTECDHTHMYAREVVATPNGHIESGEQIAVAIDKGYDLNFVLPRKAVFQWNKHALCLYRVPAKQWKKGIHSQNTAVRFLTSEGHWQQASLSASYVIKYINKPMYSTFQEFLSFIESEKITDFTSFAFSPRLSISLNGDVFLDMSQVGKYQHKNKTLCVAELVSRNVCPFFPSVNVELT